MDINLCPTTVHLPKTMLVASGEELPEFVAVVEKD